MEINIVELASETAFAYVQNLAQQLGEEHSIDDGDNCEHFNDKYQTVFNDFHDYITDYIEGQGFKHKN